MLSLSAGFAAGVATPAADANQNRPIETERPSENVAIVIGIHGPIGPAVSDFFVRSLTDAQARRAAVFVLELDTPGGLDTSMRTMIQAILSANIPVITYVSPSGARAASAGTYLLYASHIAAMAPATNLGAATPVDLWGGATRPASSSDDAKAPADTMERKVVNDASAYIRSLAELRERNADWAETAVRSAASLSAKAALDQHVIDVVATDLPDLLRQVDGRSVRIANRDIELSTAAIAIERISYDWRTKLLAVLTNPTIAYILMLVGIYGLLLEGYHPGAILPGVVGAISLLLALFAFQLLSVNYAGLALIVLGVGLIVAEGFVASFGALGIGGIIAFVVGSIILMDSDVPQFRIALPLIGGLAASGAIVASTIATLAVRSQTRRVVTGREQLLSEPAEAVEAFESRGLVRVHGELWSACSPVPIAAGQIVTIVSVDGLTLRVEPKVGAHHQSIDHQSLD